MSSIQDTLSLGKMGICKATHTRRRTKTRFLLPRPATLQALRQSTESFALCARLFLPDLWHLSRDTHAIRAYDVVSLVSPLQAETPSPTPIDHGLSGCVGTVTPVRLALDNKCAIWRAKLSRRVEIVDDELLASSQDGGIGQRRVRAGRSDCLGHHSQHHGWR